MALTSSDVKEIEVLIRKEIKSFMNTNTIKQFEDKMMDTIAKEIKRKEKAQGAATFSLTS